ncbi:hypothetical protein B6U90_03785 [Thermoplasmatales archaeon ex4484_6]|nr:MAG: hypothetical protein B6U90_03785 [Thermoplasmatales archaeon ex4484_6]
MVDRKEPDPGKVRKELLQKLENPLGFIGEKRLSHVCFRGEWTSVDELMRKAKRGPGEKDRVLSSLRERLDEIRCVLRDEDPTKSESITLFEEAVAVKRAIYILRNGVLDEEDPNTDMKRWLRYGRSIS